MKPSKQSNESTFICILIQLNALLALIQLSTVDTTSVGSLLLSKKGSQLTLNDPSSKTVVYTKKDMFEQISPIDDSAGMEDPMSTSRDPKWWDSCNAKRNETIISITSDPMRFFSRRDEAEVEEFQGNNRFLKALMLNSSSNADFLTGDVELSRRKRSIITFKENIVRTGSGDKDRNLLTGKSINLMDNDRSAFVLKKPSKINSYGLKKTSFSMNSNAKLMEQARRSKKRYYQMEQGYGNGPMMTTKFQPTTMSPLTMPTTETTVNRKGNATHKGSRIEKELIANAERLISRAMSNDIRTSWYIRCGLNAVRNLQHLSNAINQTLSTELMREKASNDMIKANLENQRSWLPALDDLRTEEGAASLQKPIQATGVLTNISHYAQLFGVALEQMIFDQVTFDKKYVTEYREVERLILKIICDIETVVSYLERLRESKQELIDFLSTANMSIDDPRLHLPKLALSIAYRSKYKLNTMDSPLVRFPIPNEATLPDSNGQVALFASRIRMPQSQRKLGSPIERLIRDQAIVNDLANMVLYYESTLSQIYVNKDK